MMHQQAATSHYTSAQAGSQHYQGQQSIGILGQGNQGNNMMAQRPMGSFRPSQQGKGWLSSFWAFSSVFLSLLNTKTQSCFRNLRFIKIFLIKLVTMTFTHDPLWLPYEVMWLFRFLLYRGCILWLSQFSFITGVSLHCFNLGPYWWPFEVVSLHFGRQRYVMIISVKYQFPCHIVLISVWI